MVISKIQAAAAADLVRTIRPGWDALATANVILEMAETAPFTRVMASALTAASNPENRSPLSIKWTEPPDNSPAGTYSHEPRCVICLLRETRCRTMAEKTGDPHPFTTEETPDTDPVFTPGEWVEYVKDLVRRPE